MFFGTKRKVFISYHHRGDQKWFNEFTRLFCDRFEIFYDNSLDGRLRTTTLSTSIEPSVRNILLAVLSR